MTKAAIARLWPAALLVGAGIAMGTIMSRQASAHDGRYSDPVFSNRDVIGTYGMLETGKVEGQDFTEVAHLRADGRGGLKVEVIANLGAQVLIKSTNTCTYDVRANGMGTLACRDDNSGEESAGDFVIVDQGRELKIIQEPNPAGWTTAIARRQ